MNKTWCTRKTLCRCLSYRHGDAYTSNDSFQGPIAVFKRAVRWSLAKQDLLLICHLTVWTPRSKAPFLPFQTVKRVSIYSPNPRQCLSFRDSQKQKLTESSHYFKNLSYRFKVSVEILVWRSKSADVVGVWCADAPPLRGTVWNIEHFCTGQIQYMVTAMAPRMWCCTITSVTFLCNCRLQHIEESAETWLADREVNLSPTHHMVMNVTMHCPERRAREGEGHPHTPPTTRHVNVQPCMNSLTAGNPVWRSCSVQHSPLRETPCDDTHSFILQQL